MNEFTLDALNRVIDYLWDNEKKHYEEDKTDDHIFNYLTVLADYAQRHQITLENANRKEKQNETND